ncbi:protein Niban 2b isoform X2 [Poeciliopsis prolifica]|uniref:protein Niban 2b isoform X2 n=1 Tax=Poeciliopsis prolifica TaxID=188132 RepID=UPI00072D409F|nr:protein Niban 2b isoform X2 [Poeciliopsis prolifica]
MGDVVSSHLDEAKREIISARTGVVMAEFGHRYEQQYAVALFNKVRFDTEGGGGPQPQLLQRKNPLENKSIFSGSIFQCLEENKKWRNRFLFVPDTYNISYYDDKASHDKHLPPKGTINCAGYKVLNSMEQYMDLISSSLPGVKAKVGSSPFLKFPSQFPLMLWHPYGRHYFFCVETEKEQKKWHAVLQDCIRHANDGLSEEHEVQTAAFTDTVRLYRQAQGHFGTWEMMCGVPSQILSNLVMETLLPELRELISPRLKGKLHERQRNWMLITDAVYGMVQSQCQSQYEATVHKCEAARSSLEAFIRTDMDQIITSKEHITNKIKAVVLPKAEKLLKVSIQPYISSILDALMEPTSRGFFEVRDVFFRELVDMSKNSLNNGTKETVAQHMEKISMLAFHPVKMQSCYEKVEQLSLEGLQQRFDVSSPSVFVQRAQIVMRKQMDDSVYTFEQILYQSLESQGTEDLCNTIQRCQDRVIKKFDYDSSTVRKRFFREALLQIFIPYMLKQLNPSYASELPRFQELIFEDFSRFILVENIFEEVVLHSVMKDIMMAVKEAAVQRRHNLYRDSIVLSNSDPSLHLLGESLSIDWAEKYGGKQEEGEELEEVSEGVGESSESQRIRKVKQVVSMIQVEGSSELFRDAPTIDVILEENNGAVEEKADGEATIQTRSPVPKVTESQLDSDNGSALKKETANPEELNKEKDQVKVDSAEEDASDDVEKERGENLQPVVKKQSEEMQEPSPYSEEILSDGTKTTPANPSDLSNGFVLEVEKANPKDLFKENAALSDHAVDDASDLSEELKLKEVSKAVAEEKALQESEECLQLSPPLEETASEAAHTTPENPSEISDGSASQEGKSKVVEPCDQDIPPQTEPSADGPSVNIQGEKKKEYHQLPQLNQEEMDKAVPVSKQFEETRESIPENPILQLDDNGSQSHIAKVEE